MLPVAEVKVGWSQLAGTQSAACWWSQSQKEDKRVGLHFCPFLRTLGQTITMRDHYVNYPEKTKIVTERQPYLRSRPLNSDMYDKEEDNKTLIVVMIVVG